jgi:hypothetical protein
MWQQDCSEQVDFFKIEGLQTGNKEVLRSDGNRLSEAIALLSGMIFGIAVALWVVNIDYTV